MNLSSAHWLDQAALTYMVMGVPIAAWLVHKDWDRFKARMGANPAPALLAFVAVFGTLVIALGWPLFLGARIALWLLQHPRMTRWIDRKQAQRRNHEDGHQ